MIKMFTLQIKVFSVRVCGVVGGGAGFVRGLASAKGQGHEGRGARLLHYCAQSDTARGFDVEVQLFSFSSIIC
jgi:hypothetical protein